MDYKSVLSNAADEALIEDLIQNDDTDGFKSCKAALADYAKLQETTQTSAQVSARHRRNHATTAKPLPGVVMDSLENIHSNLLAYWTQFGIMDRSHSKEFIAWAKETFAFKEYRLQKSSQPSYHASQHAPHLSTNTAPIDGPGLK